MKLDLNYEEQEMMRRDLCARLAYSPMYHYYYEFADGEGEDYVDALSTFDIANDEISGDIHTSPVSMSSIRLYLRPMTDMREEEVDKLRDILNSRSNAGRELTKENFEQIDCGTLWFTAMKEWECVGEEMMGIVIDYLNEHMLDWRGLIDKDLALSATKEEIEELEGNYDKR